MIRSPTSPSDEAPVTQTKAQSLQGREDPRSQLGDWLTCRFMTLLG